MALLYPKKKPIVLVFAGHDPSGGAGIQADIETIAAMGGHPVILITAHTVQNSQGVSEVISNEATLIEKQCQAIIEDMPIAAVKIGLLGSAKMAQTVGKLIEKYALPRVVLDPVLASSSGYDLGGEALIEAIKKYILPAVTVATPNHHEASSFASLTQKNSTAQQWLTLGSQAVLITGGDENTNNVINILTTHSQEKTFTWERLSDNFHGTGCTLSSAIAAGLANNENLITAVEHAQHYVHTALLNAHKPGKGMPLPNRMA